MPLTSYLNTHEKIYLVAITLVFTLQIFAQSTVKCVIKTSLGDIQLELYPKKAPITVSNFLNYVDGNLYKNSSFFRVCTPDNEAKREIKIEVVQGGNVEDEKSFNPIQIETTEQTGILHKHGTISMARAAPNSATNSFFICINDNETLYLQNSYMEAGIHCSPLPQFVHFIYGH
ncbi:MAG: hypothetical protein DRI95_09205 [Bacteroidetes bacterium]|nr:MAG: hypothetical protein DRI95_09205 [Bacteroidota bacterium]